MSSLLLDQVGVEENEFLEEQDNIQNENAKQMKIGGLSESGLSSYDLGKMTPTISSSRKQIGNNSPIPKLAKVASPRPQLASAGSVNGNFTNQVNNNGSYTNFNNSIKNIGATNPWMNKPTIEDIRNRGGKKFDGTNSSNNGMAREEIGSKVGISQGDNMKTNETYYNNNISYTNNSFHQSSNNNTANQNYYANSSQNNSHVQVSKEATMQNKTQQQDISPVQKMSKQVSGLYKQNSFSDHSAMKNSFQNLQDEQNKSEDNSEINSKSNNTNTQSTVPNTPNTITKDEDDYEVCPNCDRKFFTGRLQLHLKSCKPNKPLKPMKKANSEQAQQLLLTKQTSNNQTADTDKTPKEQQPKQNIQLTKAKSTIQNTKQDYKQAEVLDKDQRIQSQEQNEEQPEIKKVSTYNLEQFEHKLMQPSDEQSEDTRVPCSECGRKFLPDRIDKHQTACQKSQKSRGVFNSSAARAPEDEKGQKLISKAAYQPPKPALTATEKQLQIKPILQVESEEPKTSTLTVNNAKPEKGKDDLKKGKQESKGEEQEGKKTNKKIPKWKLEHEALIDNIRYNKQIKQVEKEGGDVSQVERPIDNLDALGYVQCEFCHRKFAKDTAERHIPLCKNIINRPKPPRQNSRQQQNEKTATLEKKKVSAAIVKKILTNKDSDRDGSVLKGSKTDTTNVSENATSDQISVISNKTLNTTNGRIRSNSKIVSETNNVKSRTGLLPDLKLKPADKKFFTSRKFTINSNSGSHNNLNDEVPVKHEDVYTRTSHISQVPCPYCERVFAKNAADRHIPICKNIVNRPNPLANMRNTRQSLPKKMSSQQQQHSYSHRQSIGIIPASPRNGGDIALGEYQKPFTTESALNKIIMGQTSSNFCGFCGFQFAMDHKYCGSCGKKRFSTINKQGAVSVSSNQLMSSKSNFDLPPRAPQQQQQLQQQPEKQQIDQ